MSRIVYLAFPTGAVSGGQKMILRHVETLRELGFEAVLWHTRANTLPRWLEHCAPIEVDTPFRPDDILVVPADAPNAIATLATLPQRTLVFCQNQLSLAAMGFEALGSFPSDRIPTFIAPGRLCAGSVARMFPGAQVEVIPCFADERIFRPGLARRDAIAYAPRKRPTEARAIRHLLARLHPRHAALPWSELEGANEVEVAATFGGSALFLSLSRFEAVGMTPLEAMASGCVCAGFTGVGGLEFANPTNGFWVADDDLEAAADALARAADLVAAGGGPLEQMQESARETAERWSYRRFRIALEEVWTRLAPTARRAESTVHVELQAAHSRTNKG